MSDTDFTASPGHTVGVELELQILNARDFNLARDAADVIALVERSGRPGEAKPEITESMLELNTSVHPGYEPLARELLELRDRVSAAGERLNVRIAGGGSHPFHSWSDRRIYPSERFRSLMERYGYLAKQFTVFGQHVHVGCADGDEAIYLTHVLARFVPHFIALSASSPFQEGADTLYQSSRLNAVAAFPLSGHAPFVQSWEEFLGYFNRMRGHRIVESMKDFYWDVRPKPEYGTVEVRVFDTPLTVERAARLAAYVQALASYALAERPLAPTAEVYTFYNYNRYQACRYGLEGVLIDPYREARVPLREDIADALAAVAPHAAELGGAAAVEELAAGVREGWSDAAWLRKVHRARGSLSDVARMQSEVWMGKSGLGI
ncbi:MAG: glutamate--cysteine ligase [Candidatus Rokubacteria bacterium]|nr:glutamate--cysteine ligase [Betaproteobacteria bacterium]MBM4441082.1 glutamate--cysteine ligase [Candidatus Rokubacteria bacterium]